MSLLRIKQADGSWSNIPAIKGADGLDGKDGAIQYTAGRYIQIDEDTQTINCTVKIGDLVIIDAVPVKDSTNVVSSGGVYDALETKADKTEIAGLGSEAGFITNSVEDLKNYYKKSETYSQEEVNSLLGNLTRLTLQVVQELPDVGTENIIYLVPNNESGNNIYEEWIFVQSKWEMIGTTEVDLSNYYTKEEVDALIAAINVEGKVNDVIANLGLESDFEIINMTSTITDLGGAVNSNSYYTEKRVFTLNETDRNAVTEFLNKYWDGRNDPTKQLILHSNGRFFPLTYTGVSWASDSIGANFKSQTIVPAESSKQMYAFTLSCHVQGSAGSFTPYYASSLSFWSTSVVFITDYLNTKNTKSYTPTADYHPATKKYVDDKILDAIPQKSEMPEASADYLDKIYQYIGEDTEEFTKGFFYQCISETADDGTITYSWSKLTFGEASGESSESPDYLTNIYLIDLSENTSFNAFTLWNGTLSTIVNLFADYINYWYNSNKLSVPLQIIGQQQYNTPILYSTMPKNNYGYNGSFIKSKPTTIYLYGFRIDDASDESNLVPKLYSVRISGSWTDDVFTASAASCKKLDLTYNIDLSSYTKTTEVLTKTNTTEFTPEADYHPATKKYVDDAVANAGGSGEGADLTNYYNKEEVDAKVAPLVSATDVLTKTNTTEYTPASAYHPATKQYVDQTVASSGGITEESDPTVPLHVKNITQDMIAEWDSKLDAAAVENMGFIKEESAFNGSAAKNITETDINYWDSKQDTIVFNSTYDAASNKAATMSDVKAVEDKIPEDIVFNTEYNATTNKAATMEDVNAIGGQIPTVVSAFTNDAGYVQKDYDVINMEGYLGGASNNLWISQGSIPGPKTFKQILQERLTSVYKHYLTTNDTSKLPDINLKINYHITNYDSYTPEKGVLQDFSIIIDNSLLTTIGFYNSDNTEYIEQAPITQSSTTINLYYYLPCTKISGVPAPMKIRFLCKMTISSTGDVTISSMNLYPEGRFEELTYIITTTPYEIPVLHKSSSFQMPTISTGSTNNVPFYKSNLEAMPRSLAMFNGIKDNAVINSDPAWIPEGPILLSKSMLTDETNGWAYAFDLLYERLAAGLFKVSDILYDIGTSAKLPLKLMKYSKQTYSTTENYGYCGIHLDFYDAYPKSGREVYHLEIWVKIREQYAQSNTDEDRGEIVVVNDYGWETIQ